MSREMFEACVEQAKRGNADLHAFIVGTNEVTDHYLTNIGEKPTFEEVDTTLLSAAGQRVLGWVSPVALEDLDSLIYAGEEQ